MNSNLVLGISEAFSFPLNLIRDKPKHVIYAWVRNPEWLYIGETSRLPYRLMEHSIIGRKEQIMDNDILYVWSVAPKVAKFTEQQMISYYQPKYNVNLPVTKCANPNCENMFKPVNSYYRFCSINCSLQAQLSETAVPVETNNQ